MMARDGRMFEPEVTALARPLTDDEHAHRVAICAPIVGRWRGLPAPGSLINPGDPLGEIEALGVLHRVLAPAGARGVVVTDSEAARHAPARRAVGHGERVLILDPDAAGQSSADDDAESLPAQATERGLVFRSPTSGRYYGRPSPDKPPFVSVGDEIEVGTTVCLLEVMKTFNRVVYGGPGLPERATITHIAPSDESDLAEGDVILRLE